MFKRPFFKVSIAVLLFLFILNIWKIRQLDVQKQNSLAKTALASESKIITVDFSQPTVKSSPLVFGGTHAPNIDHHDAWNLLEQIGVTMIRMDLGIENELPKNITLTDYKANKNNIQNPVYWNQNKIKETNSIFQNAQSRGMKVMGILSYSPAWLNYSGNIKGIPKDWKVYEELVKKTYEIHRLYLDMIEIWNEPDINNFLDTTGSGINRSEAYLQIFTHAVQAIQDVDNEINDGKRAFIVAPAASKPLDTTLFEYLLRNPISRYIDAVSIHSYDKDEPSWIKYQLIMKKYGKENMPIFVSEWNKTSEYIKNNEYVTGNIAIPYTGTKILQFLKGGIAGSNYFSATYFDSDSKSKYSNSFGLYRQINGKSELLPQGKNWQLLSKSLSLGIGESQIFKSSQIDGYETIGFNNSKNEKGLAIVNKTSIKQRVQIRLNNINIPKNTSLELFIASKTEDAKTPTCTQTTNLDYQNLNFLLDLPEQSVTGITISEPPKLTFNTLFRVLGISTSDRCFIGIN